MSYSIKAITPPAIEPVSVDEVKSCAHIDHDDDDVLIASWIRAGREIAEAYQNRAYIHQDIRVTLNGWPSLPFLLPRAPMIQPTILAAGATTTTAEPGVQTPIFSLTYYDVNNVETEYDANNLIIDSDSEPAKIDLNYGVSWPVSLLRSIDAVRIEYTAGYGTVPEDVPAAVRDAIILYCSYRNESRAGEVGSMPNHFYDLLRFDRIHLS
jgi:uncharacterized phiE125 gp8 family phage protein